MQIVWNVLIVLVMALGPRLMVSLSKRVKVLGMLGSVFLCYAGGFLLSLVLPDTSIAMDISEILIPIAIPLILFSADLTSIKRLAKPMLNSFLLVCAAVVGVAVASYLLYRNLLPEAYKYAGMIVGLYTGGTPNLMAIGAALSVNDSHIVLANASDVVVGGVYFLLLISIMPKLARKFLKPFDAGAQTAAPEDATYTEHLEKNFVPEKEPLSLKSLLRRVPIVLLGVLSLAIAAGLSLLITGGLNVVVIMLVVTSCGVGFSFIKPVRNAPGSYTAGQYLILVFSFGIGLSFRFSAIKTESLIFLAMFATAQFGAILLHLILAKIFKIDADTALITSTAGIYGPAFIAPAADALKNREVVLPGLICGIFGYAIGNYLGIGVALLLKALRG
ncbi:MAG TPA: DUF819 family protein [Clostridia bacterium]|nr:DUF819 family protein [Clostridia bacterium]